ncbi:MAG: GNAT family N-acetyltransferase [Alphaproteobacteria bacterium]|nr:GNAT family N-acetyltransferase [Alphaproteobacteria bacterium]
MNSDTPVPFTIRRAAPGDEAIIVALLKELAVFEKLEPRFTLDQVQVTRDLFGREKAAVCDLAFAGAEPAGLALWFWTYRSFGAERGLFIEDLYVKPQFRGQGLGTMFFAHLAGQGARLEWRVLDWNEKALAFYRRLGARPLADWLTYELEGEALKRLSA